MIETIIAKNAEKILSNFAPKLEKYLSTIELKPGELRPVITLIPYQKSFTVKIITLNDKGHFSREIESFSISDLFNKNG